jgi:threonine/homoserine/homoserine lactone efflux protein
MEFFLHGNVLTFLMTCVIIESTPGPNMGYLAIISAQYGRRTGLWMVLGIMIGLLTMGLIGFIGVGALIANSPFAYALLKYCGIGYMLYLAYDTWRPEKNNSAINIDSISCRKFFMRGFITNILNPKAAIFYVTLLPSFIHETLNFQANYLLLMTIFIFIASTIHFLVVLLASNFERFLKHPKWESFIRRAFAVMLLFIAIWMILGI